MDVEKMAIVKLNHLQEKIKEIKTVIDSKDVQLQLIQEKIWKLEVDIAIAKNNHDNKKTIELENEKIKVKTQLKNLEANTFEKEYEEIRRLEDMADGLRLYLQDLAIDEVMKNNPEMF